MANRILPPPLAAEEPPCAQVKGFQPTSRRTVPVIRPTLAEQRAAYRAIGAPVPRELRRGLFGGLWA